MVEQVDFVGDLVIRRAEAFAQQLRHMAAQSLAVSRQPGLFDTAPNPDQAESALARARMRAMIDGLITAPAPPWKDQMGVILDDGASKRAMRLVPADEARTLWAAFDAHMERLYAIWAQTEAERPGPTP